MKISGKPKLPVRFDEENQTIDDADGVVIALLTWQGCRKELPEVIELGRWLVQCINKYPELADKRYQKKAE